MPRVGDCKQGKIYAIRSHQTDQIYVGSTTQTLAQRLGSHRRNYKEYLSGKITKGRGICSSFEILKYGDEYIELLEEYPCDNANQLLRKGVFTHVLSKLFRQGTVSCSYLSVFTRSNCFADKTEICR